MGGAADEFRLTPEEDFLFGVGMRGQTLSFGPAAGALGGAVVLFLLAAFAALIGALGAESESLGRRSVEHPIALHISDGIVIATASAYLLVVVRSGLRADAEGVTLRRLRRRHIPWGRSSTSVPTRPHGRGGCSASAPTTPRSMRTVRSWSFGVIERSDGEVTVLPGFVVAGRRDGISLGGPTAAEIKIQALRRYRGHVTGSPVEPMTDPSPIEAEPPRWWPVTAIAALAIVMWSLQSWGGRRARQPAVPRRRPRRVRDPDRDQASANQAPMTRRATRRC